jgi:hypothetical protein
MARYEITAPNGQKFEINAPDDATEDQVMAYAQQQFASKEQQAPQEQPQEKNLLQKAGDVALEGMAGVNRGAAGLVDFATSPINAGLELAGSNARIPSAVDALAPATAGNFMQDGLGKDITRAAGETVPAALAMGGALRAGAQALPQMGRASESVGAGALRQMGGSTAGQDAGYAALSGAGSAVGQELGGDAGAIAGAIAAPLAPVALKEAGAKAVRSLFGGSKGQMAKVIDDFAAIGETPTVGMATGRQGIQSAENISGSAIGGGPLRLKSEKIAQSMQSRLAGIADNISEKEGAEAAGLQIQKGISGKGGFLDKFRGKSSVLWNKSDELINKEIPVTLANTKTKLNELVRGGDIGGILDNPKLSQIKAVLDDVEQVDFETLRSLRSSIGAKLGSNELVSDIPRAELKQIYGALSEDIKVIAKESGGNALSAFERANKFTRVNHDRIDDHLQRIANKVNPDEVFKSLAKGGEGVTRINAVKRSVSPEDWEVVAANVVRRLGRSNSGGQNAVGDLADGDAFSVQKFVTDWDKLGPARKAIFSGSDKINSYADDLAKIARTASVVKEASKKSANASGTAQALSRGAVGLGAATGTLSFSPTILGLTAGSVAMNNSGARLMSNPAFVKWLAQSGKIPTSRASSAIASLAGVANQSSLDDAAAIQQLVEEIEKDER